jgi:YidC/Oxa1 family membrane protein insertase
MDKNQVTGLILISLMLILYFQFFAPDPQPQETQETENVAQSPTQVQPAEAIVSDQPQLLQAQDTANRQALEGKYGIFFPGATGSEELTELENEDMKISFNSKGGIVGSIELKDFLTYRKDPLIIMDENSNSFALTLAGSNQLINLHELYYQLYQDRRGDTLRLTYSLDLGNGKSVSHIYKLPPSGFQIDYEFKTVGLDAYLQQDPVMLWVDRMKHFENNIDGSRTRSSVKYYTLEDGFDDFAERTTDFEEENLSSTKWVSFKQHFFTSALIADNKFNSAYVSMDVDESDDETVKIGTAKLNIPAEDVRNGNAKFSYYFGPNNYQILKKVAPDFSKNIYLGWTPVNVVNKYVIIPIFNFLENYIGNYGIIIMILVLVIKLFLSPLSYKSYLSMAKTKVLKPEMDEFKKKYPDDMQKQQQEQMKLYQQVGVNPLSGCIPVVLQMPILFAMFYFFPSSIELRQQSFLWATDLSTYDSVLSLPFTIPLYGDHVSLFTLLMTASTILYTWSNNQVSSVQGPMKSISYMMPVVFMFVLNSFPAALSFYYFVSNIVTFGQQMLIRKFVDEDKIRAILDENKLRNKDKTKSKFQLKLEQAMKAGEQQAKKKGKK